MLRITKIVGLFVLLAGVCSLVVNAQDSSGSGATEKSVGKTQTITGCLQKGQESGGYYLTSSEGKIWELTGTDVSFVDHVGHTVKATGSAVREPKTVEEKIGQNEKKESAGREHGDLRVTELKMVSDACN